MKVLHLVRRQIEVFLVSDDLPDLLQAQRQGIAWQLVSAHAHQRVLVCKQTSALGMSSLQLSLPLFPIFIYVQPTDMQ